ncbi:MAG: fibronectin type III domain-containing protein [Leadbetterella sp.]|nr:fibronectin type III domain-containing protein [Leadbetterella sp.]
MRKLLPSFFLILSGYIAAAQLTTPQVEVSNVTKTSFMAVVVPNDALAKSVEVKVEGPGITPVTKFEVLATGQTFLPFTFPGLQPGSTYTITARTLACTTAVSCATTSAPVVTYATTQIAAPPAALLKLEGNCPQFVGLNWSYPSSGGPVQNINIKKSYGGPWYDVVNLPPYETSYYDTDARPGIHTTYVVYTQNALGEATPSNQVSLQVRPYVAPGAPLNLRAVSKTNYSINLAWDNPEEDLGCRSNIREVYYIAMKRGFESEYKIIGTTYPFATGYEISGLEQSEPVDIAVFSYSDQGIQGNWAHLHEKTHGKSAIPTNVIGVGYKDKFDNWALGISWTHPGDDADYYSIDYSTDEGKTWINFGTVKTGENTVQHVNLSEGQKYTYRVKAGNYLYGASDYAYMNGNVSVDYSAIPNAPYGLVAKWSGSDVVLTWVDDSNKEEKYVIERAYKADGTFKEVGQVGRSVITFTDKIGTDTASAFFYRVKAENPLGVSAASKVAKIEKKAGGGASMTVYPNPTADRVSVAMPARYQAEQVEVNVYNQLNQLVFAKSYKPGSAIEVNLKKYVPGTYNVVVSTGEFKETRKVIRN